MGSGLTSNPLPFPDAGKGAILRCFNGRWGRVVRRFNDDLGTQGVPFPVIHHGFLLGTDPAS